MSSQSKQPAKDSVAELAAMIYRDLICRNVVVTDTAAQIKSNPENLAKISFELAEAFHRVEVELKGINTPKNQAFDMQNVDLDSWSTAKP